MALHRARSPSYTSRRAAVVAAAGGILTSAVAALVTACDKPAPATADAMTVSAAPVDAGRLAQNGRRRRRGGNGARGPAATDERRSAATRDSLPDPGRATPEDLALAGDENDDGDDRQPARARAIQAETGPMLPEQDDRPAHTELDLGAQGSGPQGLSPSDISRGMEPLLGRLQNCAAASSDGAGTSPRGRVTVQLRIRSTGAPSAARVSAAGGDARFVTCVRRVVASAHFPAFHGPDAVSATWGFDVD